jgi:hypothetical protein
MFILKYSSQLSSKAGPDLTGVVNLLLLGCTGRGGDRVRIELRIGHQQLKGRIEPRTGHHLFRMLTTELHSTLK